ncbi:MAG TPA: YkgJ family cysteine cluster protein [Gemmatales bacterium]|nr:YkgJ family cysteine cluster protein [Gemmatales bacterium]
MPRPLQALPVIQNWDCHQCGNCCTDYVVPVSDAEKKRIEGQGWENDPQFAGKPLFVRHSPWWKFWKKKYRLRTRDDHCIFLEDNGLCKIHAKYGLDAKPFACRLYPFILVPTGESWRVSMRYACPSATANKGRGLAQQKHDIQKYAEEMERWDEPEISTATSSTGRAAEVARQKRLPHLQGRTSVTWEDLDHFLKAMLNIIRDKQDTFPRRMLKLLELTRLCQQAKFSKITGKRLKEFLEVVSAGLNAEVPRDLAKYPKPNWVGRTLFRTTVAVFLRKDSGLRRGVAARSRWALVAAMMRIVSGRGKLPELQKGLPQINLEDFEKPLGTLEPESLEALERYYAVKIESCQFFGPTCYDMNVWDGIAFLALTLPCILWLARGYLEQGQPAAIHKAICVIDENYGYNPLLGHFRQQFATRLLFGQKELDRLIAWYGQ